MRQESTRVSKMIASRSFTVPARQCLRIANVSRPWVPAIAPIAQVCEVQLHVLHLKTMLTNLPVIKTQFRSYSIPYEDKVAKFKGKKGSDVCDTRILKDPTQFA